MQEKFISQAWKFQLFNKKNLCVNTGDPLQIISIGEENFNSGPDFLDAKILIKNILWHGHIEIHTNTSDWYRHNHHLDHAYNNVILHIVWNNDTLAIQENKSHIPILELKNITNPEILKIYLFFEQTKTPIPCSKFLQQVPLIIINSMLDKSLYNRLENKSNLIYNLLNQNKGDWQETTYQLLAYNLGLTLNANNFLSLAKTIPIKKILKLSNSLLEIEALLFGVSGTLPPKTSTNDYVYALQKNFLFLQHKYSIPPKLLHHSQWIFFRLRPQNFPTIRIAQLAQIIYKIPNLFDTLLNTPTEILYKKLKVKQSMYWQNHYTFEKKSLMIIPGLGQSSIENIIINTVIPLLITYGKSKNTQTYVDRAMDILEQLPPEKNKKINTITNLGIVPKNAFESQAALELYNNLCIKKSCLNCNIGLHILNRQQHTL